MSIKLAYIGVCLALLSPPVVSEPMQICASNAGIAQTIQEIRIHETKENPNHTYDDFKNGVAQGYSKDSSFPVFIILGDYVYRRFDKAEAPGVVYDVIVKDCLDEYKIEKAPPTKTKPIQEYEV